MLITQYLGKVHGVLLTFYFIVEYDIILFFFVWMTFQFPILDASQPWTVHRLCTIVDQGHLDQMEPTD